jgi:hypothetical protein
LLASEDPTSGYTPDTRWFLPIVFIGAALFALIDASREKLAATTGALALAVAAAIVSVSYALAADPVWYAAALSAVGIGLAFAPRVYAPRWFDRDVSDVLAATGVTASWLPFLNEFDRSPGTGAAVELAAALFYLAAAVTAGGRSALSRLLTGDDAARVPLTPAWLYAAGATLTLGYINVLASMPAAEGADAGTLALPLLFASAAFALAGMASRLWRPDFRMHSYVMSLALVLASLASAPDARTLAIVLSAGVMLSLAVALLEDDAVLGVPAALFGVAAIAAWRSQFDAPWLGLPVAYSAIALALAALALVLRPRRPWALPLSVASGLYAIAAPVLGFIALASLTDIDGNVSGLPARETALYQWSTVSVAVLGALALLAAYVSGRRWIAVPGSAVVTLALVLQIARYAPDNQQAYTVVVGTYLVLLGLVGLRKLRLAPELDDIAPFVEALGASIIMWPAFLQSLDRAWPHTPIVLAEAAGFLTLSIVLRRRAMLAAAIGAMVLVAARSLFDAVNALPNWMVVMAAGMALLAIGMAILAGRERWARWQDALLGWWDGGNDNEHAPAAG